MHEAGRFRRIGLYGPFGWGNLGDAAIQEAMIHNIRDRLPQTEFLGISLNPENTQEIHGIPSVPILRSWRPRARSASARVGGTSPAPQTPARLERLKSRLKATPVLYPILRWAKAWGKALVGEISFLWRARRRLAQLDLLVISGGGQLADFWGGPWYHPYCMFKWAACARLADTPVAVVSVGAGPIRARLSGLFIQLTLRMAGYRSYRDVESRDLLAAWGFPRKDPVYPDLAFSLPYPRGDVPSVRQSADAVIGISPLAYFHPAKGPWPHQDEARYRRYLGAIVSLTRATLSAGHPVVLFCSQIRNDRYALDDLLGALETDGGRGAPERLSAVPTTGLDHVLSQIGETDVVLTSRLHGVILSYLLHRPVIALSYDPKIDAVMRLFGQSEFCLDIDATGPEQLQERLDRMLSDLPAIHAQIREQAMENRQQLRVQYDRLFLAGKPVAHGTPTFGAGWGHR